MGITLNLEKGIVLDLTKEFGKLTKLHLGLGWDTEMDLDAFAILFDKNGNFLDTVSFKNLSSLGVSLSGDNRTGVGDGDDETIYVHLDRLSSEVVKISLFANIYSAGRRTFNQVEGSFIRLINPETNEELAKYSLKDSSRNYNAFYFADLTVNDGHLNFEVIGEGLNGSISEIEREMKRRNSGEPTPQAPQSPQKKKRWFW